MKRAGQKTAAGSQAESSGRAQVASRVTPAEDAAYMDAVKRGDMETVQRMVREAATKAMPDTKVVDEDGLPKKVYHGTPNYGFTVFCGTRRAGRRGGRVEQRPDPFRAPRLEQVGLASASAREN